MGSEARRYIVYSGKQQNPIWLRKERERKKRGVEVGIGEKERKPLYNFK